MAAITIPGENLIAQKQANNELLAIDQFVLANIPNLDPEDPVDREEQLPPSSQIVLQEQVSQMGYISPNLVVYSLMLDTGGDKFDFNWIGLYASDDDVVVSIAYLPTQTKDPSVAMTRNFMLEFSGAAETTDINVDAESWQVDFSARMDGTDERVRQLSEDTIGRQLFYGDACKVSAGENGYYNVASGTGHVAGIRFNYVEKSVLVTKFPSSIWMDVWQRKNSMSDIEPEAVAVVSQTDRVDYLDGDGVWHYLEKVAEVESSEKVVDCRRINKSFSIPVPDFNMPLCSDSHIKEGYGVNEFKREGSALEINKSGIWNIVSQDQIRVEHNGVRLEAGRTNYFLHSEDAEKWLMTSSSVVSEEDIQRYDNKSTSWFLTTKNENASTIYVGCSFDTDTFSEGDRISSSVFVKNKNAEQMDLTFYDDDLSSEIYTLRHNFTEHDNIWKRYNISFTAPKITGRTRFLIYIRGQELFNKGFYIGGSQVEKGSIPTCLLYTSPSPRDRQKSRMPSSA